MVAKQKCKFFICKYEKYCVYEHTKIQANQGKQYKQYK